MPRTYTAWMVWLALLLGLLILLVATVAGFFRENGGPAWLSWLAPALLLTMSFAIAYFSRPAIALCAALPYGIWQCGWWYVGNPVTRVDAALWLAVGALLLSSLSGALAFGLRRWLASWTSSANLDG